MTTKFPTTRPARGRWEARASFVLLAAALGVLLGFAVHRDVALLLSVGLAVVVMLASAYWFLAHRGGVRLLAALLLVVTPLVVAWLFVDAGMLAPLLSIVLLAAAGVVVGRAALDEESDRSPMPEYDAPPPRHAFVLMNPRSGGGKVARFALREKAEALGAEVLLLEGPEHVDVSAAARAAVAAGADLLGVAGGDGTQALVAGVAAELGVPFLVISAGTRNHFALDLGLDREDPSRCLAALTEDAVELHVDLGYVEGRPFVNNASFGAYAAVVQSPSYRDDKAHTTLELLPDLLTGHQGPRLVACADDVVVEHPQAVLVSVDAYGMGDIAGLGRRPRLDTGTLGVVAVNVENTGQALGLLRRTSAHGLTALEADEVVVTADSSRIPVGIDGEAVTLPVPVHCTVRPRALRVRVPRDRPGVPPRRAPWSWPALWALAMPGRSRAMA